MLKNMRKAAWLLPALFFSLPAWAQEATEAACVEGECCPPNTSQQIFIGVGTLFTGIVALFLLPRIIERAAINKGRSPLSARHTGISLAILLANLGLVGMTYAVTNCFPAKLLIWVGVVGALWLIHGVYALVATRN